MSDDRSGDKTAADGAREWLDSIKDTAARETARRTMNRFGHGLLDDLEKFLFGHVGGAEEVLDKEKQRGSALDRIRQQVEADDVEARRDPDTAEAGRRDAAGLRRQRREKALAELEQLKQQLATDPGVERPSWAKDLSAKPADDTARDPDDTDDPPPRARRSL